MAFGGFILLGGQSFHIFSGGQGDKAIKGLLKWGSMRRLTKAGVALSTIFVIRTFNSSDSTSHPAVGPAICRLFTHARGSMEDGADL